MSRHLSPRLLALVFVAAGLAAPRVAWADVPPEEAEACAGKAEGTACSLHGQAGTCKPGKCSRLDYSRGTPPDVVETDCIRCEPGGGPGTEPAPTSSTPAVGQTAPAGGGRCAVATGDAGLSLSLLAMVCLGLRRRGRRAAR